MARASVMARAAAWLASADIFTLAILPARRCRYCSVSAGGMWGDVGVSSAYLGLWFWEAQVLFRLQGGCQQPRGKA